MSGQPDQFADELRLLAGGLEGAAGALREYADGVQIEADEFDRVVEERDELRAEVARMRPVVAHALSWLHDEERGGLAIRPMRNLADAARAYREGAGS